MMDKNDKRYELILGFLTIIISLSAFKDELSLLEVDLKFISFRLNQFFFVFILGITISFYLYSVERLFNTLTIKQFKIIKWITLSAYLLFILLAISPIAIFLLWSFALINISFSVIVRAVFYGIVGGMIGQITILIFKQFIKSKKNIKIEELEVNEIKELETSQKLYDQNFYSQSIVETNKTIQTTLNLILINRNIDGTRINFLEITSYCLKKKIITLEDLKEIEKIRKLRNEATHLNVINTKDEALYAITFAKKLIKKTAANSGLAQAGL